ncbi:MAG TPA: MerR family transcriptional regulator [Gaiellaceae bacterium]
MSAATGQRLLRIGELAERSGVTPRTVRYYEEIGLLASGERRKGSHRLYDEADVERVQELTRLRDLLNLSLEDLKQLVEAEEARAVLRRRFQETDSDTERLRIVEAALPHVDTQLELVRRRQQELEGLEAELVTKRKALLARKRQLAG